MSDQLDQTVSVSITRETSAVARAAFNVPCFVSAHTAFTDRTKEYTSLAGVAVDFASTSSAYKAALAFFGQERKPPKIVIGRRLVNSVINTISTVTEGAIYTITVNGTAINYTAQSGATQQTIIDGLEASFGAAAPTGMTFTDNTGSFTIAPTVAGTAFSFKASSGISTTQTSPTETWTTTLDAVKLSSDAFYGLAIEDHTDASILLAAAWAEANTVLYGASTSSSAVPTSSTSDIASLLHAANYTRTFLLYSAVADTAFPECAWMGDRLPPVAGSAQWIHAELTGFAADRLTASQIGYLDAKKCNYYITISDRSVTKKGWVSNGTFIEETMLVDWTKSRIQERIFSRMVNSLKLPSDNAGLSVIQNDILSVLYEGVRNGGFSKDVAPYVYVPDINDIDPNLRAQGIISGITFRAVMVLSITEVIIEGVITI